MSTKQGTQGHTPEPWLRSTPWDHGTLIQGMRGPFFMSTENYNALKGIPDPGEDIDRVRIALRLAVQVIEAEGLQGEYRGELRVIEKALTTIGEYAEKGTVDNGK